MGRRTTVKLPPKKVRKQAKPIPRPKAEAFIVRGAGMKVNVQPKGTKGSPNPKRRGKR